MKTIIDALCIGAAISATMCMMQAALALQPVHNEEDKRERADARIARNFCALVTLCILMIALGLDYRLAADSINPSPQAHCKTPQEIQLAEVKNPIILDLSHSTPNLEYSKSFLTNNGETPDIETVSDIQQISKDDLTDGEKIAHTALSNNSRKNYYTLETQSAKNSITVTQCTTPTHPLRNIKDYTIGAGSRSEDKRPINIYTITVTGDKIPERK